MTAIYKLMNWLLVPAAAVAVWLSASTHTTLDPRPRSARNSGQQPPRFSTFSSDNVPSGHAHHDRSDIRHVNRLLVNIYCYCSSVRVGRPSKASGGQHAHLGQALIARRQAAGISRSALAARAGLSTNTLMKVEQGQTRDPGVLKIAALCHALSISVDDLMRDATPNQQAREDTHMTHGIVSVGYEGRSIEDFVAALVEAGVQTVADVRLNAISRKAGFSKTRLRDALAAAGIDYRHMRSLGNAKENRSPFWEGRADEGRRVFRQAIQNPEAESSLEELSALVRDQVVAVLCFETDVEMCHRKVIIDEVVGTTKAPVAALPA